MQLVQLADAFAAAALDRLRWMPALQLLADLTRSSHGQLIAIGGPAVVPFNWAPTVAQRALDEFIEIRGGSPDVNPRVAASVDAAVMEICSEAHYRLAEPTLATDDYLDFAAAWDIPNGIQTKLHEGDHGIIGLAVLRSSADGVSTDADRAIFAEAARHARTAVRIGSALDADAPLLLAGMLGQMQAVAFICDGEGFVEGMSPAAERLLSTGRLRLVGRRIDATDPIEADAIERAFARVRTLGQHGGPATIALRGTPGTPLLVLDVFALPRGRWGFESAPRVLLLARNGRGIESGAHALLNTLYGLTDAEADVAIRTALGEPRDVIAAARASSLETVRSQLKAIYAKLRITRELELARMLGPLVEL